MTASNAVTGIGVVLATGLIALSANAADEAHGIPVSDERPWAQAAASGSRDALFGDDIPKPQKPKPGSRDELFGDEKPKSQPAKPSSRDSLFGDDLPATKTAPADAARLKERPSAAAPSAWRGYLQTEFAHTYENPDHWSKARARVELGRQGRLTESLKYKISARADYDAVFDIERNFYPAEVKRDQRRDFQLRETYLDVSAGDWELRLGRQHVIWGEVPGLFFADVVSAKDMREFVLPEFDALRIPQWAARAEYFGAKAHVEFLWIPYVTIDEVGKPGADFFPFPPPSRPPYDPVFLGEQKPSRKLSNSSYGMRVSTLTNGWDLSAFAYRAIDTEANFYRQVVEPARLVIYSPRHDRITQLGGTLSKDLGDFVLKAEAIYTRDKGFSVQRLSHPGGIARLDIFDYLVGVDFGLGADTRLYAYGFQRHFLDYDSDIVPDRSESGATLQLTHKLTNTLELQALFITSLNRNDWMFRPKVTWNFAKNWRLNAGVDVMHGPPLGFFGRFADKDRVYADVRFSF
ncbi:MAG: hypothetical protein IT531_02095 [Burkholderiales bacterium]|nr:hypothetical protein [Burkholderiales bacterium]